MLKGRIVEAADAVSVLTAPRHAYTTELIRSSRLDAEDTDTEEATGRVTALHP